MGCPPNVRAIPVKGYGQCNPYSPCPATIPAHAMTRSVIRKPGAAPGRIILAIDLSITDDPIQSLHTIRQLGHAPEARSVSYPDGVHTLSVLRDEQAAGDDHLMAEWEALLDHLPADAVHLWRGME